MTLNHLELLGKRSLKSLVAPLSSGWAELFPTLRRAGDDDGHIRIMAYHRIVEDIEQAEQESIYGLVISVKSFQRHLELVAEHYEIVGLDEALEVMKGERASSRPVAVITIDDGYRDVYEQAWPVLQKLGLPAVVYLPTALISSGQLFDHDRLYWLTMKAFEERLDLQVPLEDAGLPAEIAAFLCASGDVRRVADRLNYQPLKLRKSIVTSLEHTLGIEARDYPAGYRVMNWEMAREMAAAGIEFGAHTERHVILTLESRGVAEREIRNSKLALEEYLALPARHFAYPNGYYNDAIRQIVKDAGFLSATTTVREVVKAGDDPFALGRFSFCEESTRGITGNYSRAVARLRLAA